ncbi:MAG: hypothetical protein AVDCRST_MAG85-3596, partial [uncultured Solirubrobacteraceae bacterium]
EAAPGLPSGERAPDVARVRPHRAHRLPRVEEARHHPPDAVRDRRRAAHHGPQRRPGAVRRRHRARLPRQQGLAGAPAVGDPSRLPAHVAAGAWAVPALQAIADRDARPQRPRHRDRGVRPAAGTQPAPPRAAPAGSPPL